MKKECRTRSKQHPSKTMFTTSDYTVSVLEKYLHESLTGGFDCVRDNYCNNKTMCDPCRRRREAEEFIEKRGYEL